MSDALTHPATSQAATRDRKSGRAVFDDRGVAVWEWQVDTGIFHRDVTDAQLRSLEASELTLVDNPAPRQYEGLWVHDAHRTPRSHTVTRNVTTRTRPSLNPLRMLWAHLRGV